MWYRIMHCCIPTPTTDSSSRTGRHLTCRVSGRSVANRQRNVKEFHIVWRVDTLQLPTGDKHLDFTAKVELSTMGHSLRPNHSTLVSVQSSDYAIMRGAHHCSLRNVIADVITDISVFLCLFVNWRKSEVIFINQNLLSN